MNNSSEPLDLVGHAVRALMLYALAEHQAGHATRLRIRAQGHAFSVADDGRGHAIARTLEGTPNLKLIYSQLDYPFGTETFPPVQLQGIGMSLLNSLCSELTVTVRKREASLRLSFRDGVLGESEWREEASELTGNCIEGRISPRLRAAEVAIDGLHDWLAGLLKGCPALTLDFNGQTLRPTGT